MRSTILGIGEWRPTTVRENSDWPAEVVASWKAKAPPKASVDGTALTSRPDVGIADQLSMLGYAKDAEDVFLWAKKRHVADPGTTATAAAAFAARSALADAGVSASDIDVVVLWDAIPDRPGCPSAPKVAELVGASHAHAFDIQQACASVISSLELAAGLVESGRARNVLLAQTHIGFRFCGFEPPISANVGDIATAMVVGRSELPGILGASLESDGRMRDAVIIARGRDDASDAPWWESGGPFFFGSKDRQGAQTIMAQTVAMGAQTIREACEKSRVPVSALSVVCAPHPRRWIPGAIAQTLGLEDGQAPHTYESTGHVGGCGAVANLVEARRRKLLPRGSKVALYAQGQGMTRAAVVLDWGAR